MQPPSAAARSGAGQAIRGLGDTIEKLIETTQLDKLAKLYEQMSGQPCNCDKRKEFLNWLGREVKRLIAERGQTTA